MAVMPGTALSLASRPFNGRLEAPAPQRPLVSPALNKLTESTAAYLMADNVDNARSSFAAADIAHVLANGRITRAKTQEDPVNACDLGTTCRGGRCAIEPRQALCRSNAGPGQTLGAVEVSSGAEESLGGILGGDISSFEEFFLLGQPLTADEDSSMWQALMEF